MTRGERPRPSLGAVFSNWKEYDASFPEKARLGLKNYWRRVQLRANCCGNDGEPGC